MILRTFATAGLCAVAIAAPAFAATTTYDDRATFNANATIAKTITFEEDFAPGIDGLYFGDDGGTDGVHFDGGVGAKITINRGDFAPGYFVAGDQYGSDYLTWESTLLTFGTFDPFVAIGFDFMDLLGRPTTFTFEIAGVSSSFVTGSTPKFFGVVSDMPFSTFSIKALLNNRGELYGVSPTIDTLAVGYAPPVVDVPPRGGAVPEPATWAMMLLGFGGLGAVLRRRRAAAFA